MELLHVRVVLACCCVHCLALDIAALRAHIEGKRAKNNGSRSKRGRSLIRPSTNLSSPIPESEDGGPDALRDAQIGIHVNRNRTTQTKRRYPYTILRAYQGSPLLQPSASRTIPIMEPDGKATIACSTRRFLKASYPLGSVPSSRFNSWAPRVFLTLTRRTRKSDRHLGAEFDDAVRRNREKVGRVRRLPRQRDKKPVLPQRHARIGGGLDRPAAEKERCRHDVEF